MLEKLRAGEPLSAKDKLIHEQGLVSVLRELHDALDAAVLKAYGWSDLAPALVGRPGATTPLPDKPEDQAEAEEELLSRLVALNAERAAEEARGHILWLRPDYQNPAVSAGSGSAPFGSAQGAGGRWLSEAEASEAQQTPLDLPPDDAGAPKPAQPPAAGKQPWPKTMREQVAAVRTALAHQRLPLEAIAGQFKRSPRAPVLSVLEALEALGMVKQEDGLYGLQG
ncbi:hypothetical protein [Pseudothauera rhizosphaerae]|uniref:hypothetical protein n=1 Tax=Pseudothauera rhizosphaerae TaxID=2565932 RepID=UPI001E5655F9|nr:hypothetical protein [Pseudothauera rhizosphaerae]